ncbi:MAG: site-specific integrase [Clostridiaceae bacterium]|jgi:integrase|nr:site-specific integrase [Clostridiaceae bacterium]
MSDSAVLSKLEQILMLLETKANNKSYTVAKWCDDWFVLYKEGKLKFSTQYKYKSLIKLYIKPYFGELEISKLDSYAVQELINKVPWKRQMQQLVSLMKMIFNKAVQLKYISSNPMLAVEIPKHEKQHYAAMTFHEEQAFVRAIAGSKHEILFAIMLYTGLRRGEALALRHSDIDLNKNLLTVSKAMCGTKEQKPKTKAGIRSVPISAELRPYLESCVKESQERLCPANVPALQNSFATVRKQAELEGKNIVIHSLRHTFINRCREKGIDPLVIGKWVGHKSIAMTLGTYGHVNSDYESSQIKLLNTR